jgi:hypothetical protein
LGVESLGTGVAGAGVLGVVSSCGAGFASGAGFAGVGGGGGAAPVVVGDGEVWLLASVLVVRLYPTIRATITMMAKIAAAQPHIVPEPLSLSMAKRRLSGGIGSSGRLGSSGSV